MPARRGLKSQRRFLGREPKNKVAAANIKISDIPSAHSSIAWLNEQWGSAKTRQRKIHLRQYANEARNTAGIIADNDRNSDAERKESREVRDIYSAWLDSHPKPA